jgi:hypothetical protein
VASVAELVTDVLTEASFDATETQALKWLSRAHALMCVRSTILRKNLNLGLTEENVSTYDLPAEVVQILELRVGGVPYGQGTHTDIAYDALSYLWIQGIPGSGLGVQEASAEGVDQIALVRRPAEAPGGLPIELYAVCRPGPLVSGEDSTVKVPDEFTDALVSGACATALARVEARPDLASSFQAQFDAGCAELLKQVRKRYRGSASPQIRVVGYTA